MYWVILSRNSSVCVYTANCNSRLTRLGGHIWPTDNEMSCFGQYESARNRTFRCPSASFDNNIMVRAVRRIIIELPFLNCHQNYCFVRITLVLTDYSGGFNFFFLVSFSASAATSTPKDGTSFERYRRRPRRGRRRPIRSCISSPSNS